MTAHCVSHTPNSSYPYMFRKTFPMWAITSIIAAPALAQAQAALPPEIENEQVQLLFQRLLGQLLFYPPNVAGWPGGFNWIDSSSLMLRLQIPKMIVDSEELKLAPKDNDDQMMGMKDPQVEKAKPRKNVRAGAGQA
ncbi:MAG: DUF1800 family protein, partial [Proteobacteria bacterium]